MRSARFFKLFAKELDHLGVQSLPIVAVATAFAGLVVSQEVAWHMQTSLSTVSMVPGFTAQFIVRELGIAIPALLLISKSGAALTAELALMKLTEQMDALKIYKVSLWELILLPRYFAYLAANIGLTFISILITLSCTIAVCVIDLKFGLGEVISLLGHFLTLTDIMSILIKSITFGAIVPLICISTGLTAKGGAKEVGKLTTKAVVYSTMTVIILDFVLGYLITSVF